MPLIRAALGNDVHHAAQRAAVLRLETAGLHLHFVDEVHRHVGLGMSVEDRCGFQAVHQVGVLGVAGAVDLESIVGAAAAVLQRFVASPGSELNDALVREALGGQIHQVGLRDVGLHLALRGIDQRGLRGDLHDFGGRTQFHPDIQRRQMADFQHDVALLVGAKAGGCHRQRVSARRQVGKPVVAGLIGFRPLQANQRRARDLDDGLGDHRTARVLYRSLQASRDLL